MPCRLYGKTGKAFLWCKKAFLMMSNSLSYAARKPILHHRNTYLYNIL